MSTVHVTEAKPPAHKPLSAALLAASLTVAACSGLAVAAPLMWHAVAPRYQTQSPNLAGCAAIPASSARLACYDQLGKEALSAPAKGALAPQSTVPAR